MKSSKEEKDKLPLIAYLTFPVGALAKSFDFRDARIARRGVPEN